MKILLCAYACAPGCGSEPGIGWHWARLLSREHEVHVLTAGYYQDEIDVALAQGDRPNLHIHPIPPFFETGRLARYGAAYLEYQLWQNKALAKARELHHQHNFDIAHHVTLGTWRMPSLLWKLGIPFIWGPLGGGEHIPPAFRALLGQEGRLRERLRDLSQLASHHDPRVRATMKNASMALVTNAETAATIAPLCRNKTEQVFSIGVEEMEPFNPTPPHNTTSPLRLIWVGLMEPRKGIPLLLRAIAALPKETCTLKLLGDGPSRKAWEAECQLLGINNRIEFLGKVSHDEVLNNLQDADVFAFPSLRDSAGSAVLEAMSAGLPVICLAGGGPAALTSPECAQRISLSTPEETAKGLAAAIVELAQERSKISRMGEAARTRVAQIFTEEAKLQKINAIYRHILDEDKQ